MTDIPKERIAEEELLRRPLYAFDLPGELLSSFSFRSDQKFLNEATSTPEQEQEYLDKDGLSCALCGVRSASVLDQRSHARSDVHRFNLKRKLRNQNAVSEVEFEKLVEGLSESISGSESSDSEEDETASNDLLTTLLKKHTIVHTDEYADDKKNIGAGKPPIVWLTSPLLSENVSLGVYRALFTGLQHDAEVVQSLQARQVAPTTKATGSTSDPHVFLCMMGGGHFAGMVVSLVPKVTRKHGVVEREAVVLAHKTFHRYTTRRKQGGSQSANDNAKGNAHSAGSTIRRYNEAALVTEIRELLEQWKDMLDTSELIFIRATGSQNRRTLFGYDEAVFKANDPRIRKFPMSTRRATQKELLRCFIELTRLKVSRVDFAALAAAAEAAAAQAASKISASQSKLTPIKPKISKEEELQTTHTTALTAAIRRSKAPAIISYLINNKLSSDFHLHPPNRHTPTILHLAAASGQPAIVLSLLTKPTHEQQTADPTILNADGKTPFDLSPDRPTRDAFRVARNDLGDDKWNWSKAKVPPGITKKEADANLERERKQVEREAKEEKDRRQKEFDRLRAANAAETGDGRNGATTPTRSAMISAVAGRAGNKVLGGLGLGGTTIAREEQTRGMSEEAVKRLERERRARAAEERMKAMMANKAAGSGS